MLARFHGWSDGALKWIVGLSFLAGSFLIGPFAFAESSLHYEQWFRARSLRFDFYHSGTAGEEHVSRDQFRAEAEWAGNRSRLLDGSNLGKYFLEIVDAASNRVIFSRGFSSIYGEWETTGEAKRGVWRTFHESVRFPEPLGAFQLNLKKRASDGGFRELFSTREVPAGRFVNRTPLKGLDRVWSVLENGDPATKVDLLVMGEGYSSSEQEKFHQDAVRLVEVLFGFEPFQSRKSDFNVRALAIVSRDSGITDPRSGIWRDSALGLSFNAFDLDRYVLSYRNRTIMEHAAVVPHDAVIIIFNSAKYGGGGIFNLWACCSSDNRDSEYVFVHEFGHSFAGLADEYYTSQVAYENFTLPGVEPWEPNITALLDPSHLKWSDLVERSTPIPTPWNQVAYDKASSVYLKLRSKHNRNNEATGRSDEESSQAARELAELLEGEAYAGKVGAFEGAGYAAKGLFRPELDCIMFSRNAGYFCRVCRRAIERVIDLQTRQD